MKTELLALKTKQELKKMKYPVPDFEEVWADLDPRYLTYMSANQLAKTVFFKSVTKEGKSNIGLLLAHNTIPGANKHLTK